MDFYLVEWKIILTFTAIFEKLRYRLATSERLSNNIHNNYENKKTFNLYINLFDNIFGKCTERILVGRTEYSRYETAFSF